MAVNLISGNDTTITKTNDDIQVEFSQSRSQQITQMEANISLLQNLNPTELYNNDSGTTGNVTLSDSVTNYNRIDIQFLSDSCINTTTIYNNNGNVEKASLIGINGDSTVGWFKYSVVSISGTSITPLVYGSINFYSQNTISCNFSTNNIYITKVVGYKN